MIIVELMQNLDQDGVHIYILFLLVAVPVEEKEYNPAKEELLVPRMPFFNGKKHSNIQGTVKHKRHTETATAV